MLNGRLDEAKIRSLLDSRLLTAEVDHCFACGPEEMMTAVETVLPEYGLARERVHTERFNTGPARPLSAEERAARTQGLVGVILDGRELQVEVSPDDDSILDAALRAGADLPMAPARAASVPPASARWWKGKWAWPSTTAWSLTKWPPAMY
ncbi:iron-sulfur cluster-binding domain-containing protein [Oceanimonas sp. NS1]|nr:iron-sulfur cluster-binding domain-containing protein [Oceanimonas sp. NS1]